MFNIFNVENARQTILKRQPPDEQPVPAAMLESLERIFREQVTPSQGVARILQSVRTQGDAALREWSARLDGQAPESFRILPESLQQALRSIPKEQRTALEKMAERIDSFHRLQPVSAWTTNKLGGALGQLIRPISRAGLYIPGGTAPLPSTVLMSAIPAKVAGVPEIVLVTPPQRATGQVAPIILAAAAIAGVHEVYAIGGAQAIAALAYGTESIRAVNKIYGPGNLFVTLAKKQVYGTVGIDGLAGPTETVVIADGKARPAWVAADLLAQAEHDILASAILLTPDLLLAEAVQTEAARQIESLSRCDVIAASLQNRSGIVITRDLEEAVELSNAYAPEHLCLAVEDPWQWVEKVNAAGGVFLGEYSFEVLGDYVAGPSHTMPTGGTARFASPLNVLDFVHIINLVALDKDTSAAISPTAATIARAEGLDAHARSAEMRL